MTGFWELDCLQVAYTKRVEKETILVPELMTRMESASAAHGAGGTIVMQPAIQEYAWAGVQIRNEGKLIAREASAEVKELELCVINDTRPRP
jgi:hypothetical protein